MDYLTQLHRKFQRILRGMRYILLDAKYGSWYLGARLKNFGLGDSSRGWHGAQSSDYDAISKMFSEISVHENDVIVDIGCGRGRLFNYLLNQGLKNKLIGVEVDPHIAQFTKSRLKKYKQVEILIADIEDEDTIPSVGTIFYLFNPFTDRIVQKFSDYVADRMKQKNYRANRPIIVYYNCKERLYIFENNPLWKIKKLGIVSHTGLEAAIIGPNMNDIE